MTFKQKVFNQFQQSLQDSIQRIETALADLKESGANETKSTAGDKHETALAMLQIEQANMRSQLTEVLEKKTQLDSIDAGFPSIRVSRGSLVFTSKAILFISAALGKQIVDGKTVIAISIASPLGNALKTLMPGASVNMNGNIHTIQKIQ